MKTFVARNAAILLGIELAETETGEDSLSDASQVPVIAVSAKRALRGDWAKSNMQSLESMILNLLEGTGSLEALRLKLDSPLAVCKALLEVCGFKGSAT